ncbi:COG1361 S-layer family protein [Methanococcoides methylutens]|uniref:COG1361 S-layer family protein n=1 Tax=Methanococcoides methylutens TaxID=2226 RepID=UPI004043CF82
MRKIMLLLLGLLLVLGATSNANAEFIPPNIDELLDDYYDVSGEPDLSVSMVLDPELESGETSKIFVRLVNSGQAGTFEAENEPSGPNESMDASTELDLEYDITTAVNIHATLKNEAGAPIRVFSDPQQIGYLRSGEVAPPMEFDIEIFKNAPSGIYELTLDLTYQYQSDVKVDSYPNQRIDYWYVTKNQTLPIYIEVRPRADLVVEDIRSQLIADEEGLLYITYKNVGNEVAEDAVARITVSEPFSTTDDEAFLGTLGPGDSYKAQYSIEVDSDALPKSYGIDTEVEYKDIHGNTRISDSMKVSTTVEEKGKSLLPFRYLLAIIVAGIAGVYFYVRRSKEGIN